jgi:hypothetical protein
MDETRDYKILTTTNHEPHIQLSEGDRIVGVAFEPYYKFRHSDLRVRVLNEDGLEREETWTWVEMPKELADLSRWCPGLIG